MSPLERDALPGAALDPAIARLRGEIAQAFKDMVMMPIQTAQSIVSIMERARDALLQQDGAALTSVQAAPADERVRQALQVHHDWSIRNSPGYSEHGNDRVAYRATRAALSAAPAEPSQDREDAQATVAEELMRSVRVYASRPDKWNEVALRAQILSALEDAAVDALAGRQAPKEPT